jgi:aromatic ring-opening dioxygenase catalytic subunit (LigB family)
VLEAGLDAGFDLAYSYELEFVDDVSVPLHFLMPEPTLPIVPILINCVAPPLPTPRRCYELGGFLRAFIQRRPAGERVALVGSGGMSHRIGTPGHGTINPEFDQRILRPIGEGQGHTLAALTYDEIERDGGNGAQEIRSWIAVLGALHGHKGEVLYYEPVPDWLVGCGTVWMAV